MPEYHGRYVSGGTPVSLAQFFQRNKASCDEGQLLAASEQLKSVSEQLYQASKKPLMSEQLIFRKMDAGRWATRTAYRTMTGAATLVPTAGLAGNLPEAALGIDETDQPVVEFGNAYSFTIRELIIAAKLGIPLDATKAMICMRAYEEKVDKLSVDGDPSLNLMGLLTIPAINANRKASSIEIGPNSSPAQIVQLLTGTLSMIVTRTNEAERPDCLVLPTKQREYIANTTFNSSGSERSILEVVVKNSQYLRSEDDVFSWERLSGKGAQVAADDGTLSNNHVIGAWRRDELVLRQQIPQPLEPEEPVMQARRWVTNNCALIGGVESITPAAVQLVEVPNSDASIDALISA